jgi:hypothetical protein
LRYVASTNIERTSRDFGVSPPKLRRYLKAKPETVARNPKTYDALLAADAKEVAREKDVKLVQRLSGQRLIRARERKTPTERQVRALRYSETARTRIRKVEEGVVTYRPVNPERVKITREQILNNMSGYNTKRIADMYAKGEISRGEAKTLMRKLYRNSGASAKRADAGFEKAIGE